MTKEFIGGELYFCPKCDGLVSSYDRFCGDCGAILPLPPTVARLEIQLEADEILHDHNFEKNTMERKFCPNCGRRL